MSTAIEDQEAKSALELILASEDFVSSPRLADMLTFIVEQTLEGRSAYLKAFNIANHVFGRDESFDAGTDPLVRVQASRMRKAIERYYLTKGAQDRIRISVPKGSYVASFTTAESDARHLGAGEQGRTDPTLAVLPFATMDRDDEQDYFANGITEELTTALTQVENFHVVSRHSTQHYKDSDKDIGEIGKDLGVRFIMKGTVQKSSKALRITASLIDTSTGMQVWADSYSRELKTSDIFEMRDDIAAQVTARIGDAFGVIPRLLEKETRGKRTNNLDAYDAVLRFFHYQTHLGRDNYEWARRGLERAVAKDPEYAIALAALAELACDNFSLRHIEPYDGLDEAYDFARRAVSADPACQQAHYSMAFVQFHRGQRAGCLESAEKVIALNPNAPYYVGVAGWLTALVGEWDRGLEILEESCKRNPFYPDWFNLASFQYHFLREEFEDALIAADKMIVPGQAWDPLTRLLVLTRLGRNEQVVAVHAQLEREHPDFATYARDYISAYVFEDTAVEKFHQAYLDSRKIASA
jgi:adenylate cyclase